MRMDFRPLKRPLCCPDAIFDVPMFDRSRRRTLGSSVFSLAVFSVAVAFVSVGTGQLIDWFLMPDRRALRPPLAMLVGVILAGLAVVIVVLRRLWRNRRSA